MGEASATGEGAVKQAWWPTHLMRGAGPLERESSIIQREVEKEREKEAISTGGSGWHVFKLHDTVFKRMEGSRKTAHRSGIISEHQHHFSCVWLSDMPEKSLVGVPVFTWHRCTASKCVMLLFPGKLTLATYGFSGSWRRFPLQTRAGELRLSERMGGSFRAVSNQLLQIPSAF